MLGKQPASELCSGPFHGELLILFQAFLNYKEHVCLLAHRECLCVRVCTVIV